MQCRTDRKETEPQNSKRWYKTEELDLKYHVWLKDSRQHSYRAKLRNMKQTSHSHTSRYRKAINCNKKLVANIPTTFVIGMPSAEHQQLEFQWIGICLRSVNGIVTTKLLDVWHILLQCVISWAIIIIARANMSPNNKIMFQLTQLTGGATFQATREGPWCLFPKQSELNCSLKH